jgi:hypothetical protein
MEQQQRKQWPRVLSKIWSPGRAALRRLPARSAKRSGEPAPSSAFFWCTPSVRPRPAVTVHKRAAQASGTLLPYVESRTNPSTGDLFPVVLMGKPDLDASGLRRIVWREPGIAQLANHPRPRKEKRRSRSDRHLPRCRKRVRAPGPIGPAAPGSSLVHSHSRTVACRARGHGVSP